MKKSTLAIAACFLILICLLVLGPGLFSWFGNLPFDLRNDDSKTGYFFPFGSMAVITVIIMLAIHLLARLFPGEPS